MIFWKFGKQLVVGDRGEIYLLCKYKNQLIKSTDLAYDLFDICYGFKIEVKTDTHISPNYFIEKYSDYDRGTLGGIWRAKRDKIDYYCYLLENENMKENWFEVNKLFDKVIEIESQYKLVFIQNKGYQTAGYIIPKKILNEVL